MDDHDWNEGIDNAVEEIDVFEKELKETKQEGGWIPEHADILTILKSRLLKKKIVIEESKPLKCRHCGSYKVTYHDSQGDAYCESCGYWQLDKP